MAKTRDSLLWLWPIVAVAGMAGLGEWTGPFGSVLGALVALAVLVNYVGHEVVPRGVQLWVAASCVVLACGVLVVSSSGLDLFERRPTSQREVVDLRGKRIGAADVRDRRLSGAKLGGAVLDGLDLSDGDLEGVIAPGASMRGTTLVRARLAKADLRGVTMDGASLRDADLRDADLSGADLRDADLRDADLRGACLVGANLAGAKLDRADGTRAVTRGATVDSALSAPGSPAADPEPRC